MLPKYSSEKIGVKHKIKHSEDMINPLDLELDIYSLAHHLSKM